MKRQKIATAALAFLLTLSLAACGAQDNIASEDQNNYEMAMEYEDAKYKVEGDYDLPGVAGSEESYLEIDENQSIDTDAEDTLTFSLKVDTAAYTNVARFIESGNLPPKNAVRTEELINYFSYDEKLEFSGDDPFAIYAEVGRSPLDSEKWMAFIRVKTEEIAREDLPASNLTFLIDTSGSMNSYDKLPLLQRSFQLLVESLDEDDMVSIVTYAGSSGVVLDSVSGADKEKIMDAIWDLKPSGSTAGEAGILTAYALAEKNFVEGGNNRIILASDGDFNVGISNVDDLEELISEKRDSGVYFSVLGFGAGNLRDDIMETLSKHGNGNYSYIDNVATAQKVLVEEMGSNLFTIADDVKAQIIFNSETVSSYRLVGYENRLLNKEDFDDDRKDAGEIGIGTDVVLMFEMELTSGGNQNDAPLFDVNIRYKDPGQPTSKLIEKNYTSSIIRASNTSDFGFACSVAAFGHLLRESEYSGSATVNNTIALAKDNRGRDEKGYRQGFVELLEMYSKLVD